MDMTVKLGTKMPTQTVEMLFESSLLPYWKKPYY